MRLREITIRENDEYAGLEDADEFGGDVEFMGEAHLGPHIFRVWYHKNLDRLAVDVNGYEFGFEDSHMPIAQMEAIIKKFIELRPDLLPHVMGSNSPVSRIMDIGLALVQNPQ